VTIALPVCLMERGRWKKYTGPAFLEGAAVRPALLRWIHNFRFRIIFYMYVDDKFCLGPTRFRPLLSAGEGFRQKNTIKGIYLIFF
jgi:hypothetical protein